MKVHGLTRSVGELWLSERCVRWRGWRQVWVCRYSGKAQGLKPLMLGAAPGLRRGRIRAARAHLERPRRRRWREWVPFIRIMPVARAHHVSLLYPHASTLRRRCGLRSPVRDIVCWWEPPCFRLTFYPGPLRTASMAEKNAIMIEQNCALNKLLRPACVKLKSLTKFFHSSQPILQIRKLNEVDEIKQNLKTRFNARKASISTSNKICEKSM